MYTLSGLWGALKFEELERNQQEPFCPCNCNLYLSQFFFNYQTPLKVLNVSCIVLVFFYFAIIGNKVYKGGGGNEGGNSKRF